MIGQKLLEELRGQGTYSLYTSVVLGLKNVYVKNAKKMIKNNFS